MRLSRPVYGINNAPSNDFADLPPELWHICLLQCSIVASPFGLECAK